MKTNKSPPVYHGTWPADNIPDEPLFRYFVEFRRPAPDPVGRHYDITVTVPRGTSEKILAHTAAELIASHVPTVYAADLEVASTWLDAVCLDVTHRDCVPAQMATIQCPERIRYRHDGTICEGSIIDVPPDQDNTPLEAAVVPTQIDGADPDTDAVHHVPLSKITTHLEPSDQ